MNCRQFSGLFPLGSHLCREPMPPMSEMKRDMEILKSQGFNLIKLQEHWAWDESVEGVYDFAKYEELIEYAGKLDLGVYLGLTCEQAPAWLWQKHPNCRMVGRDGQALMYEAQWTLPADGKPGPCYDDPGAMADQVRFITRLVATLGRFQNVVVWNTWQEIGYWSGMLVGQDVCFCPSTIGHFQRWLQERFGDLDSLNRQWRTRYPHWQAITPSRSAGGKGPLAVDIHWQYFMDNVQIGRVLQARYDAIRRADPLQRPIFAHKSSSAIGSGQDWAYARCQDFLGTSSYPAWFPRHGWDDIARDGRWGRHEAMVAEMWNSIALNFDQMRSCNKPGAHVWTAEFQGGPISQGIHLGRVPSPEDIRRWMLTALASGVTGISFWVTRAETAAGEINGFGLLDSEGQTSARLEEAGRIGRAINRHADLFAPGTGPQAEVAILVDEWNSQFCSALGQAGGHHAYAIRGWHRILWDMGVTMDFIEASHMDEAAMGRYNAIIVAFPMFMDEALALRLGRFVEAGGHLISEAAPGRIGEGFFCQRGELSPAMRKLFGVTPASFSMVREPEGTGRWSPAERTWGEYLDAAFLSGDGPLAGERLQANVYLQTLVCHDSAPCLRYGDAVAGAVRSHGKGRAWLLGTYVGHNGTAYCDPATGALVARLLEAASVKSNGPGELLLRKRVLAGREAWIFTNPTEHNLSQSLDVSAWGCVEDLLEASCTVRDGRVEITVAAGEVRVLIVSRKGPGEECHFLKHLRES